MHSLFYYLTTQHGEEFAPVRCNEQTLSRLIRYFEDVVTENRLPALVLKGQCLDGNVERENKRLAKLCSVASQVYLFSCEKDCETRTWNPLPFPKLTNLEDSDYHQTETGPFVLIVSDRFCGLLLSMDVTEESTLPVKTYEMMWSFDANVVFTAIEYLMSRISVQYPQERNQFEAVLSNSTPNRISWKLGFSLTTKLAMLMQRQNELEMAINRIGYAISNTHELENVLQSAVEEVGRALKAKHTELVLHSPTTETKESKNTLERPIYDASHTPQQNRQSYVFRQESKRFKTGPLNAAPELLDNYLKPGLLEIPVAYQNTAIGTLTIDDDTPGRIWESEETLMVKTVSNQLAVAISHARLFRQIETQAITDSLTGLYNHRHFQASLDRELKIAERNNDAVSLILLDLDHFKRLNDTHGHSAGDAALVHIARAMKQSVRSVDYCARYGGEEFIILLPRCGHEDALRLAERVRGAIASSILPKVGQVTASLGVATYPISAQTKEGLIEAADKAMYMAKATGRNRVRTLMHQSQLKLVHA
jgi:diguanylate cyclase (GGDEF)-like protein